MFLFFINELVNVNPATPKLLKIGNINLCLLCFHGSDTQFRKPITSQEY